MSAHPNRDGYWWVKWGNYDEETWMPARVEIKNERFEVTGSDFRAKIREVPDGDWGHYIGPLDSPTCPPDPEAVIAEAAAALAETIHATGGFTDEDLSQAIAEAKRELEAENGGYQPVAGDDSGEVLGNA